MKISVDEKPFLENGRHKVTITEVEEGQSEHKGIPFFACRMENDAGFVTQRFYDSEPSKPILAALLKAVDMENIHELDPQELIGQQLSVEVGERTYPDPDNGQQKTIKEATHFKPAGKAEVSQATNKG